MSLRRTGTPMRRRRANKCKMKMKFRRTHLTANSKQINKRRPPPTIPTSNASNIKTNQIQSSSHRPPLRTRATSNRLHRRLHSQYKTVRLPRIKRVSPRAAAKRGQPSHKAAGIRRKASVQVLALNERLSGYQTPQVSEFSAQHKQKTNR